MFLFLKLYLAHLIADFILQFEELYQLKVRSIIGHVLHVAIHALVSLALVHPYLQYPWMWLFIFLVTGIHFVQDRIKYRLQQNRKIMFLCFVVDQIIHALFLGTILFFPLSRQKLGFVNFPRWDAFYQNDGITAFLITFILATFVGSYLFHAFRRSYVPGTREDHAITAFEMSYGIFERTAILVIFISPTNIFLILASPLVGCLRLFSKTLADRLDFAMSFVYAALIGLCFRRMF